VACHQFFILGKVMCKRLRDGFQAFQPGVQPSKPHKVQPALRKKRNPPEYGAQPPYRSSYNRVVTACVTDLHTAGAVTLRHAPFEVSGCAKKRRAM
jgi:hypothetical protein